ncbi:efflux RND transporter periplasmic adaptor subunit [Caulobacter segnis]|uniref:Efflux transporter, RND family, MFP subunit n=2 Tax=Caulobacter segnis TaxID=88688 RepID=D5VKF8_CAUST|nr:efflux RND transporter periplasmic adaptor subunit [Caulobacter segnis]ADG10981.1 efflux transporter, RND family, MFP subunit [Caulobacter segnis ATCC 21756]AVQ02676.1 efflux RND transporter periplasmic adaptor subunit [Caulobacter segnis]
MNPSPSMKVLLGAGAALVVLAGAGGYGLARLTAKPAMSQAPADGRKALYWYDPMVPAQHFDKPGKSPFMDMQLVPKYAGEAETSGPAAGVRIDPSAAQNLGFRLATVEEGVLSSGLTATGIVDFNQRDVAVVQARSGGFVQRVYGRAPGDVIAAGAPLADLLVPEWGGAQAEYLAVRRTGDAALVAAARQRLRLLGMPDGAIASLDRDGRPRTTITVTAPLGGVISKLDVRAGMTVAMGQTLAEINGLSKVWVTAAVPEAQAGQLRPGQGVGVTLAAYPGEALRGTVQAVLPQAQGDSRTLQARIELANRDGRLKPGMFATIAFDAAARTALLVPSEAVIRTGTRNVVMLAADGGRYRAVEVRTGREAGGRTEILAGLSSGQRIIASGQFLIDSEASLAGLQVQPLPSSSSQMSPDGMTMAKPMAPARPALAEATGRIEQVAKDGVTLSHGPVPAIGWPAMTMTFRADPMLLRGLKVGDQVQFAFDPPPADPVIRRIAKIGGGA